MAMDSMPSGKKTHLNLAVAPDLKGALEKCAGNEARSLGNLSAVLLEWGFQQLQAAGDIVTLMRSPSVPRTKRISAETQEQLFTALRLILERAPSTVIEEVARKLSRYAAEYGDEK